MEEKTLKSVFHVESFSPTRQEKLFLTSVWPGRPPPVNLKQQQKIFCSLLRWLMFDLIAGPSVRFLNWIQPRWIRGQTSDEDEARQKRP